MPDLQFSKQLVAELNKGLSAIEEAMALCDSGENCNFDTTVKRQVLLDLQREINNVKKEFVPGER